MITLLRAHCEPQARTRRTNWLQLCTVIGQPPPYTGSKTLYIPHNMSKQTCERLLNSSGGGSVTHCCLDIIHYSPPLPSSFPHPTPLVLTSPPTDEMSQAMINSAALLLMANVVALLHADPVSGFLPVAAPSANQHVPTRTNLCVDRRTPHTVSVRAPRMIVDSGDRKPAALETSDYVPRGPAGAIKLT